jgi:superfamily II DNA or RNA helicase
MNNKIKEKVQQSEFQALKGRNRVILKWATGVGKSKMAIDLVNYVSDTTSKALFVVAEKSHIQNWKDEFLKWGLNEMDVTIICYASLHKFRNAMSKCKDLRCASTLNSYLFHLPSSIIHLTSSISHHTSYIAHLTIHRISLYSCGLQAW